MTETPERTQPRTEDARVVRRILLANGWIQLGCVLVILIAVNVLTSRHFFRLDLTSDKVYSLDLATQALVWKADKPLMAKVYFSEGLQSPYNNHRSALLDKLSELQAYSQGWMTIDVVDPTNHQEREEEARRFGIEPIEYRFRDRNRVELKRVYMGMTLIYGDREEVLPAITQVQTLEYDLARALRKLLIDEPVRRKIGYTVGHGEPNLATGPGPLGTLKARIEENYELVSVPLGENSEGVPEDIDALWVIGPQRSMTLDAQYHIDQALMRGTAVGFFLTSNRADMRTLRPQAVYHGLAGMLGHYGVQVNRDLVVDRSQNGRMPFPVRQGRQVRRIQINHPLIPKLTDVDALQPANRGIDEMLAPFVSSLELSDPLPSRVKGSIWASSSPQSGRIQGIRTLDPNAYRVRDPSEQTGQWPIVVGLQGQWVSYFAERQLQELIDNQDLRETLVDQRLRQGAPARIVAVGSADFVANNVSFMLNLADWMIEDEDLISIRSKVIRYAPIEEQNRTTIALLKAFNLGTAPVVVLLIAGLRRVLVRRRHRLLNAHLSSQKEEVE